MTLSHGLAFAGGSTAGAALLGILTDQFHFAPGLASNWIVFISAVLGAPLGALMAYLSVKAQADPALAAALKVLALKQEQFPSTTQTQEHTAS